MHNGTKHTLFAGILLLVTLLAGEIAWRTVQYLTAGTPPLTLLPLYRERRFVLSPFLVFGPRVDWQIPGKPNPDSAYFNQQAFRTRERIGPKAPGELRIIAIGGSTTEEVWNEDGLHWPLWAERELQKAGYPGVRVYNTAMSAYSSAHTLVRIAFDVMDYEPDLVIVMHNINDLTVNYRAAIDGLRVDPHYRVAFARKSFTGDLDEEDVVVSRLAHSVRALLKAQPDEVVPENYTIDDGLTHFQRNLRSIHALVTDRRATLVLLTMPVCDSEAVYRKVEIQGRRQFSAPLPGSFEAFKRDFDTYNDAIRGVADVRRTPLVDMSRLFGGEERFYSDFVHYSAAGSQRFGEILAREMMPLIQRLQTDAVPKEAQRN